MWIRQPKKDLNNEQNVSAIKISVRLLACFINPEKLASTEIGIKMNIRKMLKPVLWLLYASNANLHVINYPYICFIIFMLLIIHTPHS